MPPAARLTDMHVCPMVTPGVPPIPHVGGPILAPGAPTVLTCFLPQARQTDMCVCVGPPDSILMGFPTVLAMSLPAARLGDPTAHGGSILMGAPTVLIGDGGGSASGGGGGGGGGGSGFKTGSGKSGDPFDEWDSASLSSPALKTEEQAKALLAASDKGAPFCEECARA